MSTLTSRLRYCWFSRSTLSSLRSITGSDSSWAHSHWAKRLRVAAPAQTQVGIGDAHFLQHRKRCLLLLGLHLYRCCTLDHVEVALLDHKKESCLPCVVTVVDFEAELKKEWVQFFFAPFFFCSFFFSLSSGSEGGDSKLGCSRMYTARLARPFI